MGLRWFSFSADAQSSRPLSIAANSLLRKIHEVAVAESHPFVKVDCNALGQAAGLTVAEFEKCSSELMDKGYIKRKGRNAIGLTLAGNSRINGRSPERLKSGPLGRGPGNMA